MGFKILSPRYSAVTKATAIDFRIAFGQKTKLPNNAVVLNATLGGVHLQLRPRKPGDSRSTHRIFAECPHCQGMVPAGRTMQHKCKPPTLRFELTWAPEGKSLGIFEAKDAYSARRKAPLPYRKYLGEIAVTQYIGALPKP